MANHVSALKRVRQTATRTEVNRANRTRVRTILRALREAIAAGDLKNAQTQYRPLAFLLRLLQAGHYNCGNSPRNFPAEAKRRCVCRGNVSAVAQRLRASRGCL